MKKPSKKPQSPTFISIGQLAKLLGKHEVTLRRWHKEGALPAPFGAGKLQWLRADLIASRILQEDHATPRT
jgi:predicted DNA-binding transcriptional regulator AlpA